MNTNFATAEDFRRWTERAKAATDESLAFMIRDCRQAAHAIATVNAERANKYWDELFTYADEEEKRRKKS